MLRRFMYIHVRSISVRRGSLTSLYAIIVIDSGAYIRQQIRHSPSLWYFRIIVYWWHQHIIIMAFDAGIFLNIFLITRAVLLQKALVRVHKLTYSNNVHWKWDIFAAIKPQRYCTCSSSSATHSDTPQSLDRDEACIIDSVSAVEPRMTNTRTRVGVHNIILNHTVAFHIIYSR